MANPKDILVTTTSALQGLEVKQYLKPVSAQIVAGAGFLSDFVASFTDLFGGRSETYQNRLTAIYDEAINKLKSTAYEIGANCIMGLSIDMDEISGKGKEMFMVTAIGTAVIIEMKTIDHSPVGKLENVSVEKLSQLKQKKQLLADAATGQAFLPDEAAWDFIINNQVYEMFDFAVAKLKNDILNFQGEAAAKLYKNTIALLSALPEEKRAQLIYSYIIKEDSDELMVKLCEMIANFKLLDFKYVDEILGNTNFEVQKKALRIVVLNKPFYNKHDVEKLQSLIEVIRDKFPERGKRSMKKQMLSSKEKEVWNCECGKVNDMESHCSCGKDIYGLKVTDIKPGKAIAKLEERIELILEYIE